MDDLIVVAAHGPAFAEACRSSLGDHQIVVVDTGSGTVPGADFLISGGYSTGAYLHAYREIEADHYLFIQDSMIAIQSDFLDHFKWQHREVGCVAWAVFGMAYDNTEQERWVKDQYPGREEPSIGIFGPVFYVDRYSLDELAQHDLLPKIPTCKNEAMGSERAWAWAFHLANLPVIGPYWDYHRMQTDQFPPFRKVWADRQ